MMRRFIVGSAVLLLVAACRDGWRQDGGEAGLLTGLARSLAKHEEPMGLGDLLSVDVARKLTAERGADTDWKEDLADALVHVGDVHKTQKQLQSARKSYEEALAIRRRLAETDRETSPSTTGRYNSSRMVCSCTDVTPMVSIGACCTGAAAPHAPVAVIAVLPAVPGPAPPA